ncbi:MAG: HAD family hydrolase [Muribaculaceae bacterium]|nr:HAD family hydrolase [Muribaculaceae bacterium]
MKAALFDLDGVIIDTEPSYSIFWHGIGVKYNVGIAGFADAIKGTTLTQILDRYFSPDLHDEIISQLDEYERSMEYRLFPDALPFLNYLSSSGVPCAIVTSSNREKMANLWRQHPALIGCFQAIITDEDVTHSKPDPEPYLIGASRLGVPSQDTWVFEDSFNGLLSGRRAGAHVVALATTNPYESLVDKADIVIREFSEFPLTELTD